MSKNCLFRIWRVFFQKVHLWLKAQVYKYNPKLCIGTKSQKIAQTLSTMFWSILILFYLFPFRSLTLIYISKNIFIYAKFQNLNKIFIDIKHQRGMLIIFFKILVWSGPSNWFPDYCAKNPPRFIPEFDLFWSFRNWMRQFQQLIIPETQTGKQPTAKGGIK